MHRQHRLKPLVLALAIAGIGAGSASALQSTPAALEPAATVAAGSGLPDLTGLIERSMPAVVQVVARSKTAAKPAALRGIPDDGPLGEFLRRLPRPQAPDTDREPQRQGIGSGFIVSSDGYVLTNHHVIDGADEVTVRLDDRREFTARVIGSDRQTDIALLKIDADHLPTVATGNSDAVRVGQWVVAIGAPFGLDRTATQGIVSALGRSLPGDQYVPFIQTDAAVNPGNSGGPLLNLAGEVVGINAQIYSGSGGYMGLSFAIPINTALDTVEQLKTTGQVRHGWLGVTLQALTPDLARSFGAAQPRGALVANVEPGSPAASAGLASGDIILAYDGKEVVDSSDLPPLVGASRPGKQAQLTILRGGRQQTVTATIGNRREPVQLGAANPVDAAGGTRLALTVQALDDAQRSKLGITGGVLVTAVGDGPAGKAGLRPGDVILKIGSQPIRSVSELRRVVAELPEGRTVPLLVHHGDGTRYLALLVPPTAAG